METDRLTRNLFVSYKSIGDLKTLIKSKIKLTPEKKRYIKLAKNQIKEGRWTQEEHETFLKACYEYGTDWDKVKN
jgi:hypothetical protein